MNSVLDHSPAGTQALRPFALKGDGPRTVLEVIRRTPLETHGGFVLPIILGQKGWQPTTAKDLPPIQLHHYRGDKPEDIFREHGLNPCTLWEWAWLFSREPGDAMEALEDHDICVFGMDLRHLIISMNETRHVSVLYANARRSVRKEILIAGFVEE